MRKLFITILVLLFTARFAFCEDDLLAVDALPQKEKKAIKENKAISKNVPPDKSAQLSEETPLTTDDLDKDLKKIKEFREFINNKQKELEIIKLDLEKSDLLLKKREAEKKIYEINKLLPQPEKEGSAGNMLVQNESAPLIDSSDIKIIFLLLSGNKKEGLMTLKGVPYRFKEKDTIAARLTVEKIDSSSVTLRQPDNTILKLNFTN